MKRAVAGFRRERCGRVPCDGMVKELSEARDERVAGAEADSDLDFFCLIEKMSKSVAPSLSYL
jgi:hypothetical protein